MPRYFFAVFAVFFLAFVAVGAFSLATFLELALLRAPKARSHPSAYLGLEPTRVMVTAITPFLGNHFANPLLAPHKLH